MNQEEQLKSSIRVINDFPIKGISFKDITTLLLNAEYFSKTIDLLTEEYKDKQITKIAAIESRGFIFGAALAYKLGVGFIPIRKQGKLPSSTLIKDYGTEYSKTSIEIHTDAIKQGEKILLVDDLLATGGSAAAAGKLIQELGGINIGYAFIIELDSLEGRSKLGNVPVFSLIHYEV